MKFNHQTGKVITVGDAELYIEELGKADAPVLIMLHGGFGNMTDFNSITPELSHSFRLIGLDTRGHGRSTLGSAQLSYQLLAEDLAAVIDQLGLTRYSIIGFSDGGTTGYRYALSQDLRLDKLVTIGSGWELAQTSAEWRLYSRLTSDSWREQFPESYTAYQALNPKPDWERFASSVLAMWLSLTEDSYPFELVRQIEIPTLVVRGDQDPLISVVSMGQLAKKMKTMCYLNLPFAHHAAHDEQPELFLQVLRQFLSQ